MMMQNKKEQELPKLYPGMRLEVLTNDNRLIFVGKVDWAKGDTLQISDDSGMKVPKVEFNSSAKLRGYVQSGGITLGGVIAGSTEKFWRVEQLRSLQNTEQREFFRQSADLPVWVMCVNEIFNRQANLFNKRDSTPAEGRILDISVGGVKVRTTTAFEEGDWLFLMNVQINPQEAAFTFTCIVKRVIPKEEENCFDYGCEFCQLESNEKERLTKAILNMQRRERQKRRAGNNDW